MLLNFTESVSKQTISVNPKYVVAIMTVAEGDLKDKTLISLVNGSVAVDEDFLVVSGEVKGAMNV